MSRTDKDAPAWVRALHNPNAEANHSWRCRDNEAHWRRYVSEHLLHDCDIDRPAGTCRWWVDDRSRYDKPHGDAVHDLYYGPERAHVRVLLNNALRDYNAYGETDIEPVNRQTGGIWIGGYWD